MPRGKVGAVPSPVDVKASKKSKRSSGSLSDAKANLKKVKTELRKASPAPKVGKTRRVMRDNIHGITRPALQRILRRASVKRISGAIYESLRNLIRSYTGDIVRRTVFMTEAARRKTIKRGDLDAALSNMNIDMIAGVSKTGETKSLRSANYRSSRSNGNAENEVQEKASKTKKSEEQPAKKAHRFRPGTVAMRDIKNQQKLENLCIPLSNFENVARELSQESSEDIRFEKDVIRVLQLAVESYLIRVCYFANLIALGSKRQTIVPEDVSLVLQIQGATY